MSEFIDDNGCPTGCGPAPSRRNIKLVPFTRELADGYRKAMPEIARDAPGRSIDGYARKWIFDFFATDRTDRDIFDFLVEFRRKAHCGIDGFTSVLCAVDEFYERPSESAVPA